MSEDVEIVRGLYEAFQRRDTEGAFEVMDSDIVWDMRQAEGIIGSGLGGLGLSDVHYGHKGVRDFWRRWLEAWEQLDWEFDVAQLPDGRVATLINRQRNKGKGSGIWIDMNPYGMIWTLRDGKIVRMEFTDIDETRKLVAGERPEA